MEVVVKAKTVEEAVALGAEKLGKTVDEVSYTVIDEGKKGFLGMFSSEAEVKVYCDDTSESSENKIEEASSLADVRAESAEETDDVSYGEQENLPEVQKNGKSSALKGKTCRQREKK